jgi:hypothetical protein
MLLSVMTGGEVILTVRPVLFLWCPSKHQNSMHIYIRRKHDHSLRYPIICVHADLRFIL